MPPSGPIIGRSIHMGYSLERKRGRDSCSHIVRVSQAHNERTQHARRLASFSCVPASTIATAAKNISGKRAMRTCVVLDGVAARTLHVLIARGVGHLCSIGDGCSDRDWAKHGKPWKFRFPWLLAQHDRDHLVCSICSAELGRTSCGTQSLWALCGTQSLWALCAIAESYNTADITLVRKTYSGSKMVGPRAC